MPIPRRSQLDTFSVTRPPVPEFEVVDTTRLEIVFDTGLGLTFDLEKAHAYKEVDGKLCISMGERVLTIATSRILYTETRPNQINKPVAPPKP